MYQWADTERIAFGLAKAAPSAAHFFVYGFASSAFIGFPCPMNSAGVRCDMAQSPTLLLAAVRPAAHRLFLHAHEAAGRRKNLVLSFCDPTMLVRVVVAFCISTVHRTQMPC